MNTVCIRTCRSSLGPGPSPSCSANTNADTQVPRACSQTGQETRPASPCGVSCVCGWMAFCTAGSGIQKLRDRTHMESFQSDWERVLGTLLCRLGVRGCARGAYNKHIEHGWTNRKMGDEDDVAPSVCRIPEGEIHLCLCLVKHTFVCLVVRASRSKLGLCKHRSCGLTCDRIGAGYTNRNGLNMAAA